MTITITGPPISDRPNKNGISELRLKLSVTPSAAWVAAFEAAAGGTNATGRPSQYYVESDEIYFGYDEAAEPAEGQDHEKVRYLEVISGWVDEANTACPNG